MEHSHSFFGMSREELIILILETLTRFHESQNSPYYGRKSDGSLKLYTRNEASAVLKCSPNTVTKYIKTKKLHATYLNGVYRINETELINLLNKKTSK